MKAVLQRVAEAFVAVEGSVVGSIGQGLVVLFCVEDGDTVADADHFARKIAGMRIFADEAGRMNRSVLEVGGRVLAVSQFTLAAEWRKGNRPSFSSAAAPATANSLYQHFCTRLEEEGVPTETGSFGSHMAVSLLNDGPVTIIMDSRVP